MLLEAMDAVELIHVRVRFELLTSSIENVSQSYGGSPMDPAICTNEMPSDATVVAVDYYGNILMSEYAVILCCNIMLTCYIY